VGLIAGWLTAAGVEVTKDWGAEGRPWPFDPVCIGVHHTGGANTTPEYCIRGRGGSNPVPGPLYNVLIKRNLEVHVLSDGYANHAGKGHSDLKLRMKANLPPLEGKPPPDDEGGMSAMSYGVSLQGSASTYRPWQAELAAQVVGAMLDGMDAGDNQYFGHRHWTRRKIDPEFDWNAFTTLVVDSREMSTFTPTQEKFLKALADGIPADGGNANSLRYVRRAYKALDGMVEYLSGVAYRDWKPEEVLNGLQAILVGMRVDTETLATLQAEDTTGLQTQIDEINAKLAGVDAALGG